MGHVFDHDDDISTESRTESVVLYLGSGDEIEIAKDIIPRVVAALEWAAGKNG